MGDEYTLGVWRQEHGQKGMDVIASVEIGRQEFESYIDAIAAYRSLTERSTFQILTRNYMNLVAILGMYTNLERVGGSFRTLDKRSVNVTFMSEFANWLTSTRLYLESERDFILRQFGEVTDELRQYKAATSIAFDDHPGYRFLYNLRDYAQHCGAPLSGMTVAGGANGQQTIDFYLSRSELLVARFSWSRHARELLQQWPEHFSIMPLVDDAMAGYRQVEDEVLRILLRHCGDALATMREGITRIGSISGHPAVFRLPGSDGDGEIAWQSFPESSALDSIEHVLTTDDPLANARKVPAARPAQTPGLRHADAQAAAVIATWLEHDSGADLTNVINRIVNEDQSVDPLIGGLVNLSVYQLRMLEIVLGVSPEALLGSFIADGSN